MTGPAHDVLNQQTRCERHPESRKLFGLAIVIMGTRILRNCPRFTENRIGAIRAGTCFENA
jgi:hypothetical protein